MLWFYSEKAGRKLELRTYTVWYFFKNRWKNCRTWFHFHEQGCKSSGRAAKFLAVTARPSPPETSGRNGPAQSGYISGLNGPAHVYLYLYFQRCFKGETLFKTTAFYDKLNNKTKQFKTNFLRLINLRQFLSPPETSGPVHLKILAWPARPNLSSLRFTTLFMDI